MGDGTSEDPRQRGTRDESQGASRENERNVRQRDNNGHSIQNPAHSRTSQNLESLPYQGGETVGRQHLVNLGAHAQNPELLDIQSFCTVGRPSRALQLARSDDNKYKIIGKKLFYLSPNYDHDNDQMTKCRAFLGAYLNHLRNNRIMLVEGKAGSGKTTLVEQIAMMYISGDSNSTSQVCSGYMIVTNGCNTLTEQRLFTYLHNGQEYLGPISKMFQDARAHPADRYVFILHEWNRTSDFMSLLGNFFEVEMRAYGPDSWYEVGSQNRDEWGPHILSDSTKGPNSTRSNEAIPDNLRIILTGNPCRDDFMGETSDFMVDPALNVNRLVGAKVDLNQEEFSLERPGTYPHDQIEANMRLKLILEGYFRNSINEGIQRIKDNFGHREGNSVIMPSKLVAEIKRIKHRLRGAKVCISFHDKTTLSELMANTQKGHFVARSGLNNNAYAENAFLGRGDLIFDYYKADEHESAKLRCIYMVIGDPQEPSQVYTNEAYNRNRSIYPITIVADDLSDAPEDIIIPDNIIRGYFRVMPIITREKLALERNQGIQKILYRYHKDISNVFDSL